MASKCINILLINSIHQNSIWACVRVYICVVFFFLLFEFFIWIWDTTHKNSSQWNGYGRLLRLPTMVSFFQMFAPCSIHGRYKNTNTHTILRWNLFANTPMCLHRKWINVCSYCCCSMCVCVRPFEFQFECMFHSLFSGHSLLTTIWVVFFFI